MDFKKHCICEFGKYVESWGNYVVKNDMTPRTHEAIAQGTSGIPQGTNILFCLETGIVLKRRINTVVPMLYRVIKKTNQWGERKKREIYGRKPAFLNRTKGKYYLKNDEIQEEEGLLEDEYGPLP